jgi:hypothetical protein
MDIVNRVVSIKQLILDPNNLRLDYEVVNDDYAENDFLSLQEETLEKLESENIDDLRESILENGFIEIDRIVVKKSKIPSDSSPFYIVVEGNRRTAALKGLYNDFINGYIDVNEELEEQFSSINVCCINSDDEDKIASLSASLMGIRHVSGPKGWKGIQSAKLIYQLREKKREFKEIASLLGIEEKDAIRRYEGFLAFVQMKKDPSYSHKCQSNHYALLLEFLSNKTSRTWLQWDGKVFNKKDNIHIVYDHLIKEPAQKRAEINNTSDARLFNRHLEIHQQQIENKVKLSSLPDLPKTSESKIKHVDRFTSFINNIEEDDITEDLEASLNDLKDSLDNLITAEEG